MANVSKFNFQEIFSNDNGKSSGSGFAGVIICLVCAICFMAGVVDKMFLSHSSDVMNSCIGFATLGAALLGVRKIMQNKTPTEESSVTESVVSTSVVSKTSKPEEITKPTQKEEEPEGSDQVDNPDA